MDLVQCAHSPNTKAECVTELLCTLPFRRYDLLSMAQTEVPILIPFQIGINILRIKNSDFWNQQISRKSLYPKPHEFLPV